ncbi:MAG: hypothetical protein EP335_15005 [Alphaproteobacteria bacterium]|nr:MAG: hypothetical protein EP335_15005 [Alphaproteobacteria bacterium]
MTIRRGTTISMLAAALLLPGCGPLVSFGNDGPADAVYSLRYAGDYASEAKRAGPLLYFDEPMMAEGLAGQKVAVRLGTYRRSTLAEARWSTGLSTLVRDYLMRALSAETDAQTVGEGGLDIKVDCRLGIKIWSFDYVPDTSPGVDVVDVAIELSMVRLRDGRLLGQHTFVQTPEVTGQGEDTVPSAFNKAMQAASVDMAKWLDDTKNDCVAIGS